MPNAERNVEPVMTCCMPSTVQNRFAANGRSAEMHSTTVLSRLAARTLNSRTLRAHTAVSRLGKMLSTSRFPEKSSSLMSLRLAPVSVKLGALLPTAGRVEYV